MHIIRTINENSSRKRRRRAARELKFDFLSVDAGAVKKRKFERWRRAAKKFKFELLSVDAAAAAAAASVASSIPIYTLAVT